MFNVNTKELNLNINKTNIKHFQESSLNKNDAKLLFFKKILKNLKAQDYDKKVTKYFILSNIF